MTTLTADQVRRSMINCSKGDAGRMTIPAAVLGTDLDAVEFVAWHDPRLPGRAYLVTREERGPAGILLRPAEGGGKRAAMCALCRTTRSGGDVSLYTARRAGAPGRQGNSVGTYVCDPLDCPTVIRWERAPDRTVVPDLSLPLAERTAGLRTRLDAFLASVREGGG